MPTARSRPPAPRTRSARQPLNPTADIASQAELAQRADRAGLRPAGRLVADRPATRGRGGGGGPGQAPPPPAPPAVGSARGGVHFLAPFFTSAPVSSGGGSGTVSIHSPSRSLSCNRSAMFDSEYSNS